MQLKLSDNSKVKFKKGHYNTFGLSYGLPKNGGTCPGATCGKGGCLDTRDGLKRQTCYMAKIVAIYKEVGNVLSANTALLKGKSVKDMENVLRATINQFVSKTPVEQLYFRLHYSGDFFSEEYAQAWASVIKEFPKVTFWAYTRSMDFIEPLLGISNLTLFLSCDPSNYIDVLEIYNKYEDKHPNLGMSYLGNAPTLPGSYRFITCPETSGKLKNTADAGACAKCRLCIDNFKDRVKNIQFQIH